VTYITQTDLLKRIDEATLIQLTDDADTGEINAEVVTEAILDAEGIFESYVRTRYSLPVPTTPLVKKSCLNIVTYTLFQRRATFAEGVLEVKEKAYKETMALLKDIAAGKAALDIPAAEETIENPKTSDKILTNAAKSKFSDNALKGF
jgi:phage gp36-like protein